MNTQASKWVTIPEEDPVEKTVLKKPSLVQKTKEWLNGEIAIKAKTQKKEKEGMVMSLPETLAQEGGGIQHKGFWATGFVAVLVFSAILLAPQELSTQLKAWLPGNLLDSVEKKIEDYEGVNLLPPYPGSQADLAQKEAEVGQKEALQNKNESDSQVVHSANQAVEVQVDPVVVEVPSAETPLPTQNPVLEEASPPTEEAPEAQPPEAQAPLAADPLEADEAAALAAQQALIEKLTSELSAFQQPSQDETGGLFPAASKEGQTNSILGGQAGISAVPLPQPPLPSALGNTLPQATTAYRLNPYRVSLTPQQVLLQNQGKVASNSGIQPSELAELQAKATASNEILLQGQGIPQSGPMDLVWIALALGLFVGLRTLRGRVKVG